VQARLDRSFGLAQARQGGRLWPRHLLFQAGRITTYALLGALIGYLGGFARLQTVKDMHECCRPGGQALLAAQAWPWQVWVKLAVGFLMLALGLLMALGSRADALMEMHKQRVDLRYNPMTYAHVHVYQGNNYICTAYPVERSSMIDHDLASQKIAEKRARRAKFAEEFKKISSVAPDFRQYSTIPQIERVAALAIKRGATRRETEAR